MNFSNGKTAHIATYTSSLKMKKMESVQKEKWHMTKQRRKTNSIWKVSILIYHTKRREERNKGISRNEGEREGTDFKRATAFETKCFRSIIPSFSISFFFFFFFFFFFCNRGIFFWLSWKSSLPFFFIFSVYHACDDFLWPKVLGEFFFASPLFHFLLIVLKASSLLFSA